MAEVDLTAWKQAYDRAKAGSFHEALRLGGKSPGLLNMQTERSGFTLLHQAAWHGASRAAEQLILSRRALALAATF